MPKTKAFEKKADGEDRREFESEHSAAHASDAFAGKHGTNRSKRSAFGNCVSKMARS